MKNDSFEDRADRKSAETTKNDTFVVLWNKLKSCKKVAMSLHRSPDGDSLGSCLSMKYVLEREGVKVDLVSGDNVSGNLRKFEFVEEVDFERDISDLNSEEYDCFLFLDSAGTDRVSSKEGNDYKIPEGIFSVNIDHHHTNPYYASMNYMDESKASACSVLLDMFVSLNIEIDSELATRLLLGICTDSGFFQYGERAGGALKEAGILFDKGGRYKSIIDTVLATPLKLKKYYCKLYENFRESEDKKFGWSKVSLSEIEGLGLNESEVRLGINELQSIEGYDFVFNLVEIPKCIKGSFRSRRGIDVSLFAKELGGGGHKAAAAFRLENMSLEEAEKKVLEAIKKVGLHKA